VLIAYSSFLVGYGYLAEMSLFELRERLIVVKEAKKKLETKRRIKHSKQKDIHIEKIMKKVEVIQARREKRKIENKKRRIEKKQKIIDEKRKLEEIKRKNILEVYGRVKKKKSDKRSEEDRLAKELREINLRRQFMNANAAMVEAK